MLAVEKKMSPNSAHLRLAILASVSILAATGHAAHAAGTRAGTLIDNTATATFDQNGVPSTVNSNTHTLRVDEVIDTVVDWGDPADIVTTPGATSQVLRYTVTNTGNGRETLSLATNNGIGGDQYDPIVNQIIIDDGDGIYEPGIDQVYDPSSGITLDPDASVTIFVVSTTPGGVSDGNRGGVRLTATSRTGVGAPGTSFSGAGDGGGDAVLGTTGGDGSDDGFYQVSAATVALVKSATVADPFGGTSAVPGSVITYTIVATTSGSGNLPNLAINDAIPATTTYVPGSIRLGGAPLTDAADADAGSFASNAISVSLGTVAGGQTRTVTFQARIN